jgi:hypothetical protein
MANPEHLAKLKEGVEAWNKWRIAHCIWQSTNYRRLKKYKLRAYLHNLERAKNCYMSK